MKTNFIENDSKGIIQIKEGQLREKDKYPFQEVLQNIKVTKRSDKKKEDYIKHNRKKNGDINMPFSLSII